MITLDATIVNVALGPIVADLGGSLSAAQWIVNGYTLAFAALLLSAGALADRVGARSGFLDRPGDLRTGQRRLQRRGLDGDAHRRPRPPGRSARRG